MPTIPRRAYARPSVDYLNALRPEVVAAVAAVAHLRGKSGIMSIAYRENIEQGLLLILATDFWWTFEEVYRRNTQNGFYKKWIEYRDSEGS